MNIPADRHRKRVLKALLALATLPLLSSNCVIDTDALLTDLLQAALQSTSESLVDSLADYLARH